MFTIGPYAINSRVLLAPMAGVTDAPFRRICRRFGAGLTTSEMVTSDVSLWTSDKSRYRLTDNDKSSTPVSIQIAGSDPLQMANAAVHAVNVGAQIVDINMGCPAKKVCKKLAGSALMRDEVLVRDILNAVVASVDVPVTLKTRTGWDTNLRNGVKIAQIAENEGIQAITVHGRTRACRFQGNAEYDTISQIKEHVAIPVIANGDIDSPEQAKYVLDYTGADALMVGRAAFGNPWIFEQIIRFLDAGRECPKPTEKSVTQVMEEHLKELYKLYGDYKGIRIARKHFAWYCQKHLEDYVASVKAFNLLETTKSQLAAVQKLFNRPNFYEEKVA